MNLYPLATKYPTWITAFKDFDGDVSMHRGFLVLHFDSKEQAIQAEAIAFLMSFRTRLVHAPPTLNRPHRVVIYYTTKPETLITPQ